MSDTTDDAQRAEWLDHVTEWAGELAEEATGYADSCAENEVAWVKGDFAEVAELAAALRDRLRAELAVQRMTAGLE